MPCVYEIDIERGLVITTASGEVTFSEVTTHQDRLFADPDFNSRFDQLLDCSSVTLLDISSGEAKTIADRSQFSRTSLRAFVASQPANFGIGRMLAAYVEMSRTPSSARVFRDIASAMDWLQSGGVAPSSSAATSNGPKPRLAG